MKSVSVVFVFLGLVAFGQNRDTLQTNLTKNGFSVSANFIYNFYSNKNPVAISYPLGFIANSSARDSLYFEKYRYVDTKTFNVMVSYNIKLSGKMSLGFGLGLAQKKQLKQYLAYMDSSIYKPDKSSHSSTLTSIILPLNISYYFKRFVISAGHNFYCRISHKDTYAYQDNSKRSFNNNNSTFSVLFQETIAYRLLKNKGIYLTVSLEQNGDFYKNYGYNNWFMLGLTNRF